CSGIHRRSGRPRASTQRRAGQQGRITYARERQATYASSVVFIRPAFLITIILAEKSPSSLTRGRRQPQRSDRSCTKPEGAGQTDNGANHVREDRSRKAIPR